MGLLTRIAVAGLACVQSVACSSAVDVDLALVDRPRLLAVASTPAEAAPGASVTLAALLVDEHGNRDGVALDWSLCVARRSLAELGQVAEDCFDDAPGARVPLGDAPSVAAEISGDACRLFGPDPPPAEPGEPAGRPVDPDRTGGYYQPVLVESDDEVASYGVRLDCGVAAATQAQALELRMRHRDNLAPTVEQASIAAMPIEEDATAIVEAGARVELRVQWPRCAADTSCTGAESYALFDPVTLAIVESREAIAVAWYATAGELDDARTGRDADDPTRTSTNAWTAPLTPGPATLWIVLRDDRGGTSWRTLTVEVTDPS
ncbi:MAG TPA: hypothetical protein VFG69_03305 [Nannocystaceae bacterium]|nr:hypothetical protein [Nannocystaceae bacterium]